MRIRCQGSETELGLEALVKTEYEKDGSTERREVENFSKSVE